LREHRTKLAALGIHFGRLSVNFDNWLYVIPLWWPALLFLLAALLMNMNGRGANRAQGFALD